MFRNLIFILSFCASILSIAQTQKSTAGKPTAMRVEKYYAQVDSDGVSVELFVNGIRVAVRDGKSWLSGGYILNPFLKEGANPVTLHLKAVKPEKEQKIRVELASKAQKTFSIDPLIDKKKVTLPLDQSFTLQVASFPKTPLWLSSPAPNPATIQQDLIAYLQKTQKALGNAVRKKDSRALSQTLMASQLNQMVAFGMDPNGHGDADHDAFSEGATLLSEAPPITSANTEIQAIAGTNLYRAVRKDGSPVIACNLSEGITMKFKKPILGYFQNQWQILADEE